MNTEIIGIGSELLLGQIANTNAQYISQQLSQIGVNVYYHTAVGDNKIRILEALKAASSRAGLIITTGGLGPTMDDISKETVAEFLGLDLVIHPPSMEHLRAFFTGRGRPMPENNIKQVMFPAEAIVLPNPRGTAPGAILEKDGLTVIILPGPPYELQPMFEASVIPYLLAKSGEIITSRVIRIYGIGESAVEVRIADMLQKQGNPTIAPLAGYGEVTLRITAKALHDVDAQKLIAPVEAEILSRLGSFVYGYDDDRLETVVVERLRQKGMTLALAESCTGGLVSNLITDVPGASEVFLESCITYSNDAKTARLGVSPNTLSRFGAVSAQVASEMAQGIRETGARIGAAITGIAGPGGGTLDKPVGLVFLAIADEKGTDVKQLHLHGDRQRIKHETASQLLNWLRIRLEP